MSKKYLIGIDSGTTGIKAVIFDTKGNELFSARRKLEGLTPYEDWYEEDMDDIYTSCYECIEEVLKEIEPQKVIGIGVTAQGDGLWMMDEKGSPVRPGMCFCDGRTGEIIDDWREKGVLEKTFHICGTVAFGSSICAEIKWLEKNEPEALEKASVFFHLKDWLFYKLTGIISCDESDMSIPMLNAKTNQYDDRLFELFEIEKYRSKFPKTRTTSENRGRILPELAERLGLNKEVLVVGGPMDIAACALGCGAIHDGQASTVIGTAAIHSVIMDEPRPEPYMAGMTLAHCIPGRWIRLVSSLGGAPNLEWFLEQMGSGIKACAKEQDKDVYDYCSELIANVPIGSRGVIYHPYLMAGGERSPFFKSNIKASFMGISFNTKTEDMLRAVYEGIAMAMVDCYRSTEADLKEIYVSGGGAKSDVWMQIFADAMDTDIVICSGTEFGAKGAALNVGVALGIYSGYEDAAASTVHEVKRFKPDKEKHKRYQKLYGLYRKGYELSMDWWDLRTEFLNTAEKEE